MTMTHEDVADAPVAPARQAVTEMIEAGLLDEVLDRAERGDLALTGSGGFLPELVKAVLERGLAAELTGHLGYEKSDPAGRGGANSRNGSSRKTGDTAGGGGRAGGGGHRPRPHPAPGAGARGGGGGGGGRPGGRGRVRSSRGWCRR